MTETTAGRAISRRALFLIFTASGFSGLIYESIWSHYLKLFLGHAAYAQTLVLTVFMGGMALGAWLAARMSPKLRNLLLVYALVEAITGAIALGFHPIYLAGTNFTFEQVIPALDSPTAINSVKWLIAALLILPQSILLGTTFPLISGAIVRRFPESPGGTLAMLYFTNSFGAALGVLASGFLFIGWIGLPGTVVLAGVLNIAIAVLVWRKSGAEPAPPTPAPAPTNEGKRLDLARIILLAAFLSGAAAFVYEIAWIRMLSLVLGSSTHAFELMLSTFILGLALGGLWIRRRIDSLAQPLTTLGLLFALMAVLAMCTLPAYNFTFDIIGAAVRAFPATDAGYRLFNLTSHGVAALFMLPTTIVAGMTLPIMTHVLLRSADERAIGRVYASNTLGAIAGVLLAVHLLLPSVGLKGAVIAGAILQLVIAVLFILRQPIASLSPRSRVSLGAVGAVVLLIAVLVPLDPMRMASGVFRHGAARLPENIEVEFLRHGKTASIALMREGSMVAIATNGKPDATINMDPSGLPSSDEITMTLAAALPLAMHPAPRQVANIGLGSGLTSSALLASPEVQRLDSIEIEPVMAEAARLGFEPRVSRLFNDPRSHLHFEDAKTFFSASKQRYDIIISEPSNPWVSGVATLFSDEFYAQIVRHMNEGGLLVQWIQIYETDIGVVASVFKALGPHFDDYAVYATENSNILIIATPHGDLPPLDRDLFAAPQLAAELRRVGIESMGDIDIRLIGNKRMLDALMRTLPVPANSDFYPYVDITAQRMRFLKRDALELVMLGSQPVPLAEIFGQPLRRPASDSQLSTQLLTRHEKSSVAKKIMAAIVANDPSLAPEESRVWLSGLRITATDCQDLANRNSWRNAVHAVATETTPFLTIEERAPLWELVRQHGCIPALTVPEAAWLGILEATGRGDVAGIAAQGEKLFTTSLPELSGAQVLEALIATSAAQLAIGKGNEAKELLGSYVPTLQDPGGYRMPLAVVMGQAGLRVY